MSYYRTIKINFCFEMLFSDNFMNFYIFAKVFFRLFPYLIQTFFITGLDRFFVSDGRKCQESRAKNLTTCDIWFGWVLVKVNKF